tara:strand:- start:611 stop:1354 length:744 start_codon:yes stop_codon:yes gene_type:complete
MITKTQNYKEVKNLLSKGSTNSKTAKNNIETYILYLAPHTQNSKKINICPKASKGCAAACLFSAGRGRFSNVIASRTNKTEYYLSDKKVFINQLSNELVKIASKSIKQNTKIAIRLNGTSDLDFIALIKKYNNLDLLNDNQFKNLVFYDYTAILGKVKKYINTSYKLTLSRKENNESEILEALKLGGNVAAVFKNDLPTKYKGFTVIDGDQSDLMMLYNKNVILGLKAKGDAKKDKSGFVIDGYNLN